MLRCQKCNIGELIFHAGGEYKILPHQFFDGNTLQNSVLIKQIYIYIYIYIFFFFFFITKGRRIRNSRTKDFPFE